MKASQSIPKVVKLDSDIPGRLERLGKIKHRSPHSLMKEAIDCYVAKEEKLEQLNIETQKRWSEAEQGRVVSNEAMNKWLNSWGSDNESERPLCGK